MAAKPRLRPKSYIDYEALLRLHIRPVLGTRPLSASVPFDIQSIYAQMFERGFPLRLVALVSSRRLTAFRSMEMLNVTVKPLSSQFHL